MRRVQDYRSRVVDTLEAADALFAPAFAQAVSERLYVAHLDERHRLIGIRIRYAAEQAKVAFPVRDIIADALSLGSDALILAHNHPSGDPTPSGADIDATRTLVQVARPLGVTVRDHLIYGGGAFLSFRQQGLL